jgi:periplasmic copper chaperone A
MANREMPLRRVCAALLMLMQAACTGEGAASAEPAGWVRPAEANAMTAAYFTVPNRSAAAQVYTGVRADVAVSSTFHETRETDDGMSSMHPLDSIVVPPGDSLAMRPRGQHVMVHGLSRALAPGDTVALQLLLRSGDSVTLRLPVIDR